MTSYLLTAPPQVLPTGEEVKLQRNALEVLERPSGNEQASWRAAGARSHIRHRRRLRARPTRRAARPPRPSQDMSEEEEEEQRRQQQQQQMAAARGYPYEPAEPHAEGKASISIGRRRPPGCHTSGHTSPPRPP